MTATESWQSRIARHLNPDGSVNVPGYIAKWLESKAKITADYRIRLRDNNSELYEVLMAIHSTTDDLSANGSKVVVADRNQPELSVWLTTMEAGELLGRTDRTVRNLCRTRKLAATKKGRAYLIRRVDLHAYQMTA